MTEQPTLVPTSVASKMLGVSQETIRRYIKKGILRALILPSGIYRVYKEDVEKILTAKRNSGEQSSPQITEIKTKKEEIKPMTPEQKKRIITLISQLKIRKGIHPSYIKNEIKRSLNIKISPSMSENEAEKIINWLSQQIQEEVKQPPQQ